MPRLLRLLVLVVLTMVPASADATDLRVGEIVVPPPEGHCPFDPKFESDRRALEMAQALAEGVIEVLGQYADCRELAGWRSGYLDYLSHWALVWRVPVPAGLGAAYADPAAYCTKAPSADDDSAESEEMRRRLEKATEQAGDAVRNFSTVDLGALFFDAEACYTGGVQTADLKRARGRMALFVRAVSVHEHSVVWAALYEATDDPTALDALLERTRAWRRSWRREG